MLNENIIKVLNQLIRQKKKDIVLLKEEQEPDKKKISECSFKIRNFSKALEQIKTFPEEIQSGNDVKELKGVGKGIITRIDEIIDT